jgi:hypothetical protein
MIMRLKNQRPGPKGAVQSVKKKFYYHSVQNILSPRLLYKSVKINMYETRVLLVVLYGWETWSLTLKEDQRMELFENRVLRGLFEPKWNEIIGWRKLLHGDLHVVLFCKGN